MPLGRRASGIRVLQAGFTACRLKARAVLAATLVVASLCGTLHAEDFTITWAVYDAPPFMIADGPDRDAGIFDRLRHLLDSRLSEATSRTLRAPFPRILASLKDGADLCFIGGIKTPEREGFAVFSLPVAMFYPLRIVVRGSERGRFEARAPLSLSTLLADRSVRTSVLRNRFFDARIDALLRDATALNAHSEFGEAFRMLQAGRIDYLVEYSAMTAYRARRLGQHDAFAVLPFAEAPEPVLSRVMCPKTERGRRLVDRIDSILREERRTPAYRRIVEAWAEPGDLATIREAYDRSFLASE